MLSYWPHQALTSMIAGWSMTIAAATTAQNGLARKAYTMSSARPMSASDAGIFISVRIHGSALSVTVRNAGSRKARTAHT